MQLVDSHCHLDRLDLEPFQHDFATFVAAATHSGIEHMLCVAIDLEAYPDMLALVEPYDNISVSVGVHPNDFDRHEPTVDELVALAQHPKNVAIGETGLDYFRTDGSQAWQISRFRTHIEAAKQTSKPLIIHTRAAQQDTLSVMQEMDAGDAGGVMHCFTEDWDMAKAALDMGFYISFSGIVTFNNAADLRDVAKKVPADRILIETDTPYLAPVPHRGKPNQPAYVALVAETLASVRGVPVTQFAQQTTENYYQLFGS